MAATAAQTLSGRAARSYIARRSAGTGRRGQAWRGIPRALACANVVRPLGHHPGERIRRQLSSVDYPRWGTVYDTDTERQRRTAGPTTRAG